MNFFQAQEDARKRTRFLFVYFGLCVVGVVVAVELLLFVLMKWGGGFRPEETVLALGGAGVLTLGVILMGSLFKTIALRRGGAVVAQDLGGRRLLPGSNDTDERRLLNVVEEMAIASGVPVPQVYLMDDELGINAFAAGTEPSNAVIGVTRGCVQDLSRSELQGVVAHEFSHILNGDMSLNMRLIGMVFGLVLITMLGRILANAFRFMGGRNRDNKGLGIVMVIFLMGLGLLVIGAIGTFFARVLQAAVSREREYLADASAVQFTRDPGGLAGALKKIGGQQAGSKLQTPKALEASHLFFADGGLFAYGLATHPPLDVRIRAIEPGWDGKFIASGRSPERIERPARRASAGRAPWAGGSAVSMLGGVGDSARVELARGRVLRERLAPEWVEAARDSGEARTLMFGLLMAVDPALRVEEVEWLRSTVGSEVATRAERWQDALADLHSADKIALVDLSIPALRGMSEPEYRQFVEMTRRLVASDGLVTLFESMLQHLLERHLDSHFAQRGFPSIKYHTLEALGRESSVILSAMARLGRDPAEAEAVWESLRRAWEGRGDWVPELLSPEDCGPRHLGPALDRFERASPIVKEALLEHCAVAAAHDGQLSSLESELLRLVADTIGCGVPPFIHDLELS